MRSSTSLVLACALVLVASRAQAQGEYEEPWYLTIGVGPTGPLNEPAMELFNVGVDASLGVYRSLWPELALGGRVRTGVLSEGGTLPQLDPGEDPGVLDYGYIGTAMRVRPFARHVREHTGENRRGTSLYLDLGPGLALLDGDVVPAYEAALGYNFSLGPIAMGPNFRFTHFIETNGRFANNHILTWTGGLEVAFLDQARDLPQPEPARPQQAQGLDRDGDWFLDERDNCPDEAEVWNGFEDTDGCPDEGTGQFENDALVVDERVFFDYDSAALRPTGAEQLDLVVAHHQRFGERYDHLVIAGHADARGPEPYNDTLSRKRGELVVIYLKDHGVLGNRIQLEAHGEEAPAVANADTEFDHQVNRRVEFRVEWRVGMRPEGLVPRANPSMPEYVDAAPVEVQEREARIAAREQRQRDQQIARRDRATAREVTASIGEGRGVRRGRGVAADEREASLEGQPG